MTKKGSTIPVPTLAALVRERMKTPSRRRDQAARRATAGGQKLGAGGADQFLRRPHNGDRTFSAEFLC